MPNPHAVPDLSITWLRDFPEVTRHGSLTVAARAANRPRVAHVVAEWTAEQGYEAATHLPT